MRITVDRALCQEHGQCAIAGPGVFRLDDEGRLEYDATPDASLRGDAEDAADACPMQAIALED